MLPDVDLDTVELVARRLCGVISGEPMSYNADGGVVPITTSIGMTIAGEGEEPVADILKRADMALYRAKRNGRNRVEIELSVPEISASGSDSGALNASPETPPSA